MSVCSKKSSLVLALLCMLSSVMHPMYANGDQLSENMQFVAGSFFLAISAGLLTCAAKLLNHEPTYNNYRADLNDRAHYYYATMANIESLREDPLTIRRSIRGAAAIFLGIIFLTTGIGVIGKGVYNLS